MQRQTVKRTSRPVTHKLIAQLGLSLIAVLMLAYGLSIGQRYLHMREGLRCFPVCAGTWAHASER